jgi:flagellar biosynthesis protein FlhG
MSDQAEVLRNLVRDRQAGMARTRARAAYTIAVTSGKGGVGKTSVAVNLALMLAKSGRSVRLVDADFGLSNAEVLMGISTTYTLEDVLVGRIDAADAWENCPGGIKLLSSGSGLEEMANADARIGSDLGSAISRSVSNNDIVVIDTAPGIDNPVSSVLELADEVIVVTTPEPTSITDCYAAIKTLIAHSPDANITLLANSCASPAQAASVASGLEGICKKFLGRSFNRYEYLPEDPAVSWAIRNQKPLALALSQSMVSTWLRRAAIKLDERIRHNQAARDIPGTLIATR